jgi:hypothetical protein
MPPIASPSHQIQNFETKQAIHLAFCPRSSQLSKVKILCGQVSSFAIVNQQTMMISLLLN